MAKLVSGASDLLHVSQVCDLAKKKTFGSGQINIRGYGCCSVLTCKVGSILGNFQLLLGVFGAGLFFVPLPTETLLSVSFSSVDVWDLGKGGERTIVEVTSADFCSSPIWESCHVPGYVVVSQLLI